MRKKVVLLLATITLHGCAVVESPRAWDQKVVNLNPDQLSVSWGGVETVSKVVSSGNLDFAGVIRLTDETNASLQAKIKEIETTLDYSSGGNYLWGILGAGAVIAKANTPILSAIAFGGGVHVALSNRLSPTQQLANVVDAMTRISCLKPLAEKHQAVFENAERAQQALKAATTPAAVSLFQKVTITAVTTSFDEQKKKNVDDLLQALRRILLDENAKMITIFTATPNANLSNDLVAKTQAAVVGLKQNAQSTNNKNERVDQKVEMVKGVAVEGDKSAVEDVKKMADLEKDLNAKQQAIDDATTTLAVDIKACTG